MHNYLGVVGAVHHHTVSDEGPALHFNVALVPCETMWRYQNKIKSAQKVNKIVCDEGQQRSATIRTYRTQTIKEPYG